MERTRTTGREGSGRRESGAVGKGGGGEEEEEEGGERPQQLGHFHTLLVEKRFFLFREIPWQS